MHYLYVNDYGQFSMFTSLNFLYLDLNIIKLLKVFDESRSLFHINLKKIFPLEISFPVCYYLIHLRHSKKKQSLIFL